MIVRKLLVAAAVGAMAPLAAPAAAQLSIGIGVGIRIAPPPLPVYAQPPLPGPDYLWTPGYWAWDDDAAAYYWVPGTWVRAPRPGLLWTPPWWGWSDGLFVFHTGYWGPRVGFYGGVPYGFGYTGIGFQGGYWSGGHVAYNGTVTNITNVHVTNVYRTVVVENHVTRVSYNGGPGGVRARPTSEERSAIRDPHVAPTGNQQAHVVAAHADPGAFAAANHGRPPMLATARPLARPPGAPASLDDPRDRGRFAGAAPQPASARADVASRPRGPEAPGPRAPTADDEMSQPSPAASFHGRLPDGRLPDGAPFDPARGRWQPDRADAGPDRPGRAAPYGDGGRPPARRQPPAPASFAQARAPAPPAFQHPRPAPRPMPNHPHQPDHPHQPGRPHEDRR